MNNNYASITSIIKDSNNHSLKYVNNDNALPYVENKNVFYYFAHDGRSYNLVMLASFDIMLKKEK